VDTTAPALDVPSPRHAVDVAVLVRRTHALLAAGVPLTLLIDLGDEAGPHSQAHYEAEGGDACWRVPAV
jgi:hypothetical protein